jgi:hypothetical protein
MLIDHFNIKTHDDQSAASFMKENCITASVSVIFSSFPSFKIP